MFQLALCSTDGNDTHIAAFQDMAALWHALFGVEQAPTVLVGHSMGGAIAVRTAALKVSHTVESGSESRVTERPI